MRRGVVLVLSLILLAVLVSVVGLLIVASLARPTTVVPASATLVLPVEAPWSEVEPSEVLQQFFDAPPSLRSTIDLIRRAKTDTRIKALVIRPATTAALWAQLQELHAALVDFKSSGKPVVAFLEAGGTGDYYIATAASRIVLMPAGQLDLTGLASYELFFRGALDKIGVFPDLLHIGDYKSASNTFTERDFTPAHREMTESLNRDWYEELVRAVAAGRNVSEEAARGLIDGGPYMADGALAAGLVDALAYDDQLDDNEPIQGTETITHDHYARAAGPAPSGPGRIALLYAVGTIASGESSLDSPTGMVLGSQTFVEWVRKVRVDPSIDAVVVRIDSPGGSAIASEVIWRELMLTRDVKPLVVSLGDVAASGGYYIAAPAHAIVAQPGTLTGSIGVVTGKFVMQGALDKLGVGSATVSTGRLSEIYSPFRPFSAEEREKLSDHMRATYDLFVQRVADGREQPASRIDAVAQGRVWTGRQARELGLVDELGGLDDALRIAGQRARLDPQAGVQLVVYPPKRSLYEILSRQIGSSSSTGALESVFGRPNVKAVQAAASVLPLFRRGEPLAILPNVFVR
ncbi:MAG: signal peptide peptidase SppA [Acidobacteria bacterium]|nr:signal peptide peptidase SppA [Acidobacteriota bacterium]